MIIVHTLAFGGRGIFFAGGGSRKSNSESSIFPSILATAVLVGSFFTGDDNDLDSTSTWTCNVHPCTLEAQVQKKKKRPSNKRISWRTLIIFSIFLVAVVLVGSFVAGDGNRLFDSNRGYPGEGPKHTMTDECAKWHKTHFSDEQVRAIAKNIAFFNQNYRHACMQSRYNYCNGGYSGRNNPAYNRLRKAVVFVKHEQSEKEAKSRFDLSLRCFVSVSTNNACSLT